MGEKCGACRFWEHGDCRRHPPVVISTEISESKKTTHWQPTNITVTRWPKTSSWQGCGEFEKKED